MQNILWNLFGIDVPNVMSDSVDEKKLTSETSCRRERVNDLILKSPHFNVLLERAMRFLKNQSLCSP